MTFEHNLGDATRIYCDLSVYAIPRNSPLPIPSLPPRTRRSSVDTCLGAMACCQGRFLWLDKKSAVSFTQNVVEFGLVVTVAESILIFFSLAVTTAGLGMTEPAGVILGK